MGTEKMQDVVSVKRSGVAYYKSPQPCWNGESTPQRSGWEAQGKKATE